MASAGTFSGTGGGISGLLRLRRRPSAAAEAAFVAFRPAAGSVSGGGNLIWGRQLRPALLLDRPAPASAAARSELLRPVAAASSSSPAEGSDSAGEAKVGFAAKYPALVTGFFFFMWYFLNVIFNIINKKIYNYFPYPYFVSVVHLFVGVVYCLVSWAVGLPKRAVIVLTSFYFTYLRDNVATSSALPYSVRDVTVLQVPHHLVTPLGIKEVV